jgi:anti-anti-sigma factor
MNKLDIQTSQQNDITLLDITGEIDESNLQILSDALDPLIESDDTKAVVLILKGVEFINSKVLGYLASTYSRMNEQGKKISIAEPSETVADIISLIGLSEIIEVYSTIDEAVHAL